MSELSQTTKAINSKNVDIQQLFLSPDDSILEAIPSASLPRTGQRISRNQKRIVAQSQDFMRDMSKSPELKPRLHRDSILGDNKILSMEQRARQTTTSALFLNQYASQMATKRQS